jgi:hypothetical protein
MRKVRGWIIEDKDARLLLGKIEERIRSSYIEVEHRDALIRLRSLIEDELADAETVAQQSASPGDGDAFEELF